MNERKRWLHLLITVTFLVGGILGLKSLTSLKKEVPKHPAVASLPMVQTVQALPQRGPIQINGQGTVQALNEIQISPQVSGKIIFVSKNLVNGGFFAQGETLVKIDPADYELALILAQAKVKEAENDLKISEAEAEAARREWAIDPQNANVEPPPLAAKEPQLAAARARLEAGRAETTQAMLNLERTVITAPFNGRAAEKNADLGQYAAPAQVLATIYCVDAAEIIVPLDDADLEWFVVPGFTPGAQQPSPVRVLADIAGRKMSWQGHVTRAEGRIDEQSRMISVVVRVENPYAQKPPLVPGLFVNVEIQGRALDRAVSIPRAALRNQDTVWVVDADGVLHFQHVAVARMDQDRAVIASGLSDGQIVAASSLRDVSDGMKVRPVPIAKDNRP